MEPIVVMAQISDQDIDRYIGSAQRSLQWYAVIADNITTEQLHRLAVTTLKSGGCSHIHEAIYEHPKVSPETCELVTNSKDNEWLLDNWI